MNQRHIHDDGYSFQNPLINNLNNKKVFEAKNRIFQMKIGNMIIIITTTSEMKVILLDVSIILVLKIMI